MRRTVFSIALWTLACTGNADSVNVAEAVADTLASQPPPSPIGLYGEWLRVAPPALAGDTLRLSSRLQQFSGEFNGCIPVCFSLNRFDPGRV